MTIKLARLEGAYRKSYAMDWADVAVEADRLLRTVLRCFPHDGNLRLQLASVEFVRDGAYRRRRAHGAHVGGVGAGRGFGSPSRARS